MSSLVGMGSVISSSSVSVVALFSAMEHVGSVDTLAIGLSLFLSGMFWIAMFTSFALSLMGMGLISTVVLAFPIGINVALSSSSTKSSLMSAFPKLRRASAASSSSVVVAVSCPTGNDSGTLLDTDSSIPVFIFSDITKLLLCWSVFVSGVLVTPVNSLNLLEFTTRFGSLSVSSCGCGFAGFP